MDAKLDSEDWDNTDGLEFVYNLSENSIVQIT